MRPLRLLTSSNVPYPVTKQIVHAAWAAWAGARMGFRHGDVHSPRVVRRSASKGRPHAHQLPMASASGPQIEEVGLDACSGAICLAPHGLSCKVESQWKDSVRIV